MKQKHIDAAREVRLWLSQIVIPAVGIVAVVPEAREAIVNKYYEVKNTIKTKFAKK